MERMLEYQKAVLFLKKNETSDIYKFLLEIGIKIMRNEPGMIMNSVSDLSGNPFYLGEILVTETEAELDGAVGYGMTFGNEKKKSVILAAIDIFINTGKKDLLEKMDKYFKKAIDRYTESISEEERLVTGTKVNFGLMTEA